MDFKESLMTAARWIASVYKVPPQLINVEGGETYNNLAEARLALWQQAVIPLLEEYIGELNNWLAPMFGDNIFIKFNPDTISALEPERQIRYDRVQNADYMTINEKREMVGLDKDPAGDVILVDAAKIPLESVSFSFDEGIGQNNGKDLLFEREEKEKNGHAYN